MSGRPTTKLSPGAEKGSLRSSLASLFDQLAEFTQKVNDSDCLVYCSDVVDYGKAI